MSFPQDGTDHILYEWAFCHLSDLHRSRTSSLTTLALEQELKPCGAAAGSSSPENPRFRAYQLSVTGSQHKPSGVKQYTSTHSFWGSSKVLLGPLPPPLHRLRGGVARAGAQPEDFLRKDLGVGGLPSKGWWPRVTLASLPAWGLACLAYKGESLLA